MIAIICVSDGLTVYLSCRRGLWGGSVLRINQRPALASSHPVAGDIVVELLDPTKAIWDLVVASLRNSE